MEAISFLLILCVTMPLKYIWEMPQYNMVVGMAHGILFLLYIAGAWFMKNKLGWTWKVFLIVAFCSVLPFGPFYVERKYL